MPCRPINFWPLNRKRTYFFLLCVNFSISMYFYSVGLAHVHSHQTMWIKCSWLLCTDFDSFGKSTNETRNSNETDPISILLASTLCEHIAVIVRVVVFVDRFSVCVRVWLVFPSSTFSCFVLNEHCRHCVTVEVAKACISHFAFCICTVLTFFLSFLFLARFFVFSVWFAKHFIRFQLHQCSVLNTVR